MLQQSEPPTYMLDSIFTYPTITDRGEDLSQSIGNMYQTRARPEPSEFLMNGTLFMIQKSLSKIAATQLTTPLPGLPEAESTGNPQTSDHLSFQKCCQCAGEYLFRLPSGNGSVTIIKGAPQSETPPYKAMSYVWGSSPQAPLRIPCDHCGHITLVPMSHSQRFRNLMELGGSGNTIWLDALSIDQADAQEVASNVAIMGTIYKNARCVSVLLPSSDEQAFKCLRAIEADAKGILYHHRNFIDDNEVVLEHPSTGERINFLSDICQHFVATLQLLSKHLGRFSYWNRAWTFQEWALANDLEVAVEGGSEVETCFNLKSLVLGAAMLISRYKLSLGQYATIKVGDGISRGNIPALFNTIKAFFPDEDLFLSYEEIDPKAVSFQTNFAHFGVDQLLGVRPVPPVANPNGQISAPSLSPRPDPLAHMRARLVLLLSSFASSRRNATFEADLVASWASMCNIAYAYNRNDDFTVALRKVSKVLHSRGFSIYHFLPDTTGGLLSPSDSFRGYAMEHRQLNATNQAELPGAPVFTGRADTATHLMNSLNKINLPTHWNCLAADDVQERMRKVEGAEVTECLALDNIESAMSTFAEKAMYGASWDITSMPMPMFLPIQRVGKTLLGELPAERRAMAKLVIVKIAFRPHNPSQGSQPHDLFTWAIIPNDIALQDVTACREPTNGTLVLSTERDGVQRIVAYLTMSDHFCGTFLVKTDQDGMVDLTLRIPERGDLIMSFYRQIAVRQLSGRVQLDGPSGPHHAVTTASATR